MVIFCIEYLKYITIGITYITIGIGRLQSLPMLLRCGVQIGDLLHGYTQMLR